MNRFYQFNQSKRRVRTVGEFLYLLLPICLATVIGCVRSTASRFDNIVIRGSSKFDDQVEKALALLKTNAPGAYEVATTHVAIIEQADHSGMEAWLNSPKFQLNDRSAFYSVTWCAGVIAHDSFHSKLYHDYLKEHPQARWVPDKIWKGEGAEKLCLEHQRVVMRDIGAPALETRHLNLTNRYWEVDYRQRNW